MSQREGQEQPSEENVSTAAFWDDFARQHGRDLQRCAARAMRTMGWRAAPADVEELVQEVYCRLLERPRNVTALREASPPARWAYLHRIVRSVVVDALRGRAAKKRGGAVRVEHHEALLHRRAPGASPEERLVARERARELRRRVCELGGPEHGARNVRILELSAVEGCTAAEISRRMAGALTPSSVHTVLHRLRRQLADAY